MSHARSRLALLAILALGLLLQLPSLSAGFYADDYVLALPLGEARELVPMRPWSAFDFGARADWAAFEEAYGSLPWWTSPDWRIRFFRPLASLSFALDHWLWGGWAVGHHLASLALFALLLALAHGLYRALGLGRGAALFGLALLALSDASVLPVGWPANRNSLLEALFAVGAVRLARRGAGAGALALAAGAALSKESGALTFLLVAWALASSRRAQGARGALRSGAAVWIAVGAFCAWLGGLALAGYGTQSLYYATPWREPLRYLGNLAVLATGGAVSLAAPFPIDAVVAYPRLRVAVLALGLFVGVPLWLWVARTLRARPSGERSSSLFLALWAIVFLLPQAGAAPGDRLLFVSSIGACGLLAQHFTAVRERWRAGKLGLAAKGAAAALLASATAGSGASLALQGLGMAQMADHLRTTALATEVGPTGSAPVRVVALQTDGQMQGFTLGATWHGAGGDRAVQFAPLQFGRRPLRWTRLSDAEFELESLGEPFLTGAFERVYLARESEARPGGLWRSGWLEVDAPSNPSGELRRLRVTLDRSLDDPALRFVAPQGGVLRRLEPPAVGQSVELSAPEPALPFLP